MIFIYFLFVIFIVIPVTTLAYLYTGNILYFISLIMQLPFVIYTAIKIKRGKLWNIK